MKQWTAFGAGSALALLLGTTAVQADVTAEQVWQGWVDYYTASGQVVTSASSAMEGDTLVVKDAVIASKPNDEGSVELKLSEVRLRETGDGKVEVTVPAEMPAHLKGKDPEGKEVETTVLLGQNGLLIVASGAPEDITYDVNAATMAVSLQSAVVEGQELPTVEMKLNDVTGKSHLVRTSGFALDSTFGAASADLTVSAKSLEEGKVGSFDMTGSIQKLAGSSKAQIAEGADMSKNLAAALAAGTNVSGEFSYESAAYTANFASEAEGDGKIDYKDSTGKIHFAMSKDALSYGGESGGAQITVSTSSLPVPLDLSIASSLFDFAMPVTKGEGSQPFKLVTKLIDLKVSDAIWDMFDPTKQLPRDPATVVIDTNGKATMHLDIFDPATAEGSQVPGQIDEVTLNELKVSAAGAELTGTGHATIDNSGALDELVRQAERRVGDHEVDIAKILFGTGP